MTGRDLYQLKAVPNAPTIFDKPRSISGGALKKNIMKRSLLDWYYFGGRIPRKVKKKVIGYRVSGCMLRRAIKETIPMEPIKMMFDRRDFYPHGPFCPNCGCTKYAGCGNKATYPEHWEEFSCLRCRTVVAFIDNSPFTHKLEYRDKPEYWPYRY